MESADFEAALAALSEGYSEGIDEGVGLRGSDDGGRYSLFERELARRGIISFNLYRLRSHNASLNPCEMSAMKVTELVLGFRSSSSNATVNRSECPARS